MERMDPRAWRKKKARLPLADVALLLGVSSPNTVRRYETGEREAPNSIALAYERVSAGAVSAEDLNRARSRFLRKSSPSPVIPPIAA